MNEIGPGFIEGTAKQIKAELMRIPDDKVVRLMIGRPSLSMIAHKLQKEASANGITQQMHDDLLATLKNEI